MRFRDPATGAVTFDAATLVSRNRGIISLASGSSGSFTVPKEAGEKIVAVLTLTNGTYDQDGTLTINDATSTISYVLSSGTGGYIVFGVY